MRIAIGVEYEGAGFCGWQTQPSLCGVQDVLDGALAEIAAHPVVSQCAGRTDAGVHALGQVAHFDAMAQRPLTAWVRGANARLPRSIAVTWAKQVPDTFHARYAARGRSYTYLLLNRPERPGVHFDCVGWHHRDLDVERMRAATEVLLGTHDFSAFRAAECQARSPVKELRRAQVDRFGEFVVFVFAADAFLHHMVRNIVGCLIKIGNGARPVAWLTDVLESRDRRRAAPTFPASGLYLTGVEYDASWGLPAPRDHALERLLPRLRMIPRVLD